MAGADKAKVLIVEDSLTVRRHLADVILGAPDLAVAGEAADGKEAIAMCLDLGPEVISMDIMMPVMTGLAATEFIMAHRPTPIVIVSASINRGEVFHTYDALAAGAVDVIEKPDAESPAGAWVADYLAKLRMASRIRVITHPRAKLPRGSNGRTEQPPVHDSSPRRAPLVWDPAGLHAPRLVAIGASTGGPGAVLELLRGLPEDFGLPILLVLHIADAFGPAFASWLDGQLAMPVRLAEDGEVLPRPGRAEVLVAPPGRHLVLSGGRLRLLDAPERNSCRPSVDVLFESIASELGPAAAACLLTGMGRDGAVGLRDLLRAGAYTIAQDEASSIIWGMPGEAVQLGAAAEVLPLSAIAGALSDWRRGEASR